jgi:hypothetical protein
MIQNLLLNLGSNPVTNPRSFPRFFKESLQAIFFYSGFNVVVMFAATAQLLARFRDIAQRFA